MTLYHQNVWYSRGDIILRKGGEEVTIVNQHCGGPPFRWDDKIGMVLAHRKCHLADDEGIMHGLRVLWEDGTVDFLHSLEYIELIFPFWDD